LQHLLRNQAELVTHFSMSYSPAKRIQIKVKKVD